ncbi:retrovirus-related pol polyprotein from transposon TNT 1-94, partial [Tanacetum coccineum]
LYDGNVIKNTSAIVIPDSEETLMLAEESCSKMLLKQKEPMMLEKKVNTTLVDYANSVNSPKPTLSNRPTNVEVPKELPKRPTGQTFTIVGNACPLTRITTTTEVRLRKLTDLENETSKPIVTLVYSRKPRKSKTNVPISKSKVIQIILCACACAMGKSKKKPHKPKSEDTNQEKLYLLHMDLCGPICVASVNGKKYILVIQNGVVKRRNRTLIEAAHIMLIYAKASLFLWEKAVATACYTQNRSIVRLHYGKTPYELLHDKPPDLSFFHVFGALCYPINDSENLGKLPPKADIDFDELTVMASEHNSSGPALHEMTLAIISSGLVPNPPPSILVDHPAPEVNAPIADVVAPEPVVSIGSPSSTTIDQDAPSPSNSQTTPKTQSPIIPNDVEEENHDLDVEHINNDPFFGIPILEVPSDQSSSTNISHTIMHLDHQISKHNSKWTKDHPLENIIGDELGLGTVFTRISQRPRGIFINQSKYALESLKKYGFDTCDPVYTPMVEKSKLDVDKEGNAVDPSHDHGSAYRKALTCCQQDLSVSKRNHQSATMFLGDRLVSWSSKRQKSVAISSTEAEYIVMSGYCAQILWMRSQLTNYGLGLNKIPMYCDNKSAIALCCNNVQHSRSKHIEIRFHFIKEHVENGVIKLYFVNMEYQLADIFTKPLAR